MSEQNRTQELGNSIKQKRTDLGMSLDAVAVQTGTSKSTLSRIERGIGWPDVDTIGRLSTWLNQTAAGIIGAGTEAVIYYPTKPTPDIVQDFLDKDEALAPNVRVALGELFRVAYAQFAKR